MKFKEEKELELLIKCLREGDTRTLFEIISCPEKYPCAYWMLWQGAMERQKCVLKMQGRLPKEEVLST